MKKELNLITNFNESVNNIIINKNNEKKSKYNKKNLLNKLNCYNPSINSTLKIMHIIITRYLLGNIKKNYVKFMKSDNYTRNAKRVLYKYLLPSLEHQKCKDFIWVFMLGKEANISFIKTFFNFHNSFETKIIYEKDMKHYLRQASVGFDALITTRIDYDDVIYYDGVNNVRKEIDINKPILLHGYHRGYYNYDSDDRYFDCYIKYNNIGFVSIFISFITFLNKVNDTYSIYELGDHTRVKKFLLKNYKSFGIKKIN